MDTKHFDTLAKSFSSTGTRRGLVRLLAALPLGVTLAALHADGASAAAKKKGKASERGNPQRGHRRNAEHRRQTGKNKGTPKKDTCRDCCRANGSSCTKKSQHCKPSLCQRSSTTPPPAPSGMRVSAPFAIEAVWTNPETDHDTYLFVPNDVESTVPAPFIRYECNPDHCDSTNPNVNCTQSDCEDNVYPFICVSQDALGPGDEITTVRTLLAGTYEYWIEVDEESPAGDLTVNLRDTGGSLLRSWSSPPNPSGTDQISWHVFDIDGATGIITSVDQTIDNDELPEGAHNQSTDVCPYE